MSIYTPRYMRILSNLCVESSCTAARKDFESCVEFDIFVFFYLSLTILYKVRRKRKKTKMSSSTQLSKPTFQIALKLFDFPQLLYFST